MFIASLRRLRLNCYLAALLPALLAAGALFVLARGLTSDARTTTMQALRAHAALSTVLLGQDGSTATWLEQHSDWLACARLGLDEQGIVIEEQAGEPLQLIADAPPPELVQATTRPQAWLAGGIWRAAAPIRDAQGEVRSLLYIEARHSNTAVVSWLTIGGTVLAGLLLAWYLARRVYHPVLALASEADRALAGEPSAMPTHRSQETEAVASSIMALASAYRSSRQASESAEANPAP